MFVCVCFCVCGIHYIKVLSSHFLPFAYLYFPKCLMNVYILIGKKMSTNTNLISFSLSQTFPNLSFSSPAPPQRQPPLLKPTGTGYKYDPFIMTTNTANNSYMNVVVVEWLGHVRLLQPHGRQPARLLCPRFSR